MVQSGSTAKLLLPALTLAVLVAALGLLALFHPSLGPGQSAPPGLVSLTGSTMGTRYRVLLHQDAVAPAQQGNLRVNIDARLAFLDRSLFSTYVNDSQLSVLNRQVPGVPMTVAKEVIDVLFTAGEVFRQSGGAFDITVKPLVDLWGFGDPAVAQGIPAPEMIELALSQTGMRNVFVNTEHGTVMKGHDLSIDLSAIAKGFAVDDISRLLESRKITDYLVEIGGEVRIRGSRPGGQPWQVAIEAPVPGQATPFQALQTGNRPLAIAASGNYRNFFMHEGIRYSHTIDPDTGWPVSHNLASVTVIAESAMLADAWATALAVLGPETGMELANELQLAAYFIVDGASGFSALHSAAFNRYL